MHFLRQGNTLNFQDTDHDTSPTSYIYYFGSAHNNVTNFVMCDGAVRSLAKSLDTTVYSYLIQRNDGNPVDWSTPGL